jgi:hypothetical protein
VASDRAHYYVLITPAGLETFFEARQTRGHRGCPRQTFTEQVAQVPVGMRASMRLRTALAVASGSWTRALEKSKSVGSAEVKCP